MRVFLMNTPRGVSGQSHPDFFGDVVVSEDCREGMPKRMEAVAVNGAPRFIGKADDALGDTRPLHDLPKCFRERTDILALRERWKDKGIVVVGRGKAQ